MGHHVIKIFMSSPSDVSQERDALTYLADEINDVLEYLGPTERRLRLQVLRYETDTYPDYGSPQEVVNRQMPDDYHIFLGVMWARCGTPTRNADSGTIEEFDRARKRRERTGLPKIMFYFCDEAIRIPDLEGVDQLAKTVKFRESLASQGLTSTFATHDEFRHVVRGGLLRAIRDIRSNDECLRKIAEAPAESLVTIPERQTILGLAAEYDDIRRRFPSSSARTRRMTAVFSRMTANAASVRGMTTELKQSPRAGERLAAIAILSMFPDVKHLDWLAERLDPDLETPFVGYQSASALLHAVRSLERSDCGELRVAIEKATRLAEGNPRDPDRLNVLAMATTELTQKCEGVGER